MLVAGGRAIGFVSFFTRSAMANKLASDLNTAFGAVFDVGLLWGRWLLEAMVAEGMAVVFISIPSYSIKFHFTQQ